MPSVISRGNRANIDKKYLAAGQISERAKQFGQSQELSQLFRSNEKKLTGMIDKIGSRDHGGKMEDLFKDYAMKQKDSLLWDEDLFGRLLPDAQKQREFQREQDQNEYHYRPVSRMKRLFACPEACHKHTGEICLATCLCDRECMKESCYLEKRHQRDYNCKYKHHQDRKRIKEHLL